MRKTAQQQLLDARAALAKAQERGRREDTRRKIVVGAAALNFIHSNPGLARSFLQHLETLPKRPNDDALFVGELALLKKAIPPQVAVQPAKQGV